MTDTIVAQATPSGKGGVGIIRISGPSASEAAKLILGKTLSQRTAHYLPFNDHQKQPIDQGIALFFNNPHSFTGEDVLELHAHGGPIIMDMLLESILTIEGIRLAKPGEFSEQAFLNDKLDLTQAEAIADLINASSRAAATSALRSLKGEFSDRVNTLSEQVLHLRMYVEAAIDFPDEEIDFLSDGKVASDLTSIKDQLDKIYNAAEQGAVLREGLQIVIAGKPNAGKSSLLNALAGKESAIVTDIPGTTRDVLNEYISINGIPLHIIDTAGLRESNDKVEQIGIERAWKAIRSADHVLFVVDGSDTKDVDPYHVMPDFMSKLDANSPITVIKNKIDLTKESPLVDKIQTSHGEFDILQLSAYDNTGIDVLRNYLVKKLGLTTVTEGQFIARRRHIDALDKTKQHINLGDSHLHQSLAGELLAEELRLAHLALCEITGEFTSDDLLGKIFSSFCIGK